MSTLPKIINKGINECWPDQIFMHYQPFMNFISPTSNILSKLAFIYCLHLKSNTVQIRFFAFTKITSIFVELEQRFGFGNPLGADFRDSRDLRKIFIRNKGLRIRK